MPVAGQKVIAKRGKLEPFFYRALQGLWNRVCALAACSALTGFLHSLNQRNGQACYKFAGLGIEDLHRLSVILIVGRTQMRSSSSTLPAAFASHPRIFREHYNVHSMGGGFSEGTTGNISTSRPTSQEFRSFASRGVASTAGNALRGRRMHYGTECRCRLNKTGFHLVTAITLVVTSAQLGSRTTYLPWNPARFADCYLPACTREY